MAVFVAKPTPYVEEFLQTISVFDYPRDKISLYLYNNQPYNEKDIEFFVNKHGKEFKQLKVINLDVDLMDERMARAAAM
jgi:hypothetical protein